MSRAQVQREVVKFALHRGRLVPKDSLAGAVKEVSEAGVELTPAKRRGRPKKSVEKVEVVDAVSELDDSSEFVIEV